MGLKVTSSEIQIVNSDGTVKFTSNEPLIFISGSEHGTHTIGYDGAFYNRNSFYLTQPLLKNEIGVLYITITTITGFGDPGTSFLNVRQPANAVIPIYVRGYPSGNTPAADTTHMAIAPIIGDQIQAADPVGEGYAGFDYLNGSRNITGYNVQLIHYPTGGGDRPYLFASGNQGVSNPTITFDWTLYKYRYLETT